VNQDIAYARMSSPIGPVWIATTGTGICAVGLGPEQPEAIFDWLARRISSKPPYEEPEALAPALAQLREYFSRIRREFDLPLDIRGTPFQKAVWAKVASIPYGTTTTYGEIAQRIGQPGSAGGWSGKRRQSTAHPHPLPPGHRGKGRADRIRRGAGNKGRSVAAGRDYVTIVQLAEMTNLIHPTGEKR